MVVAHLSDGLQEAEDWVRLEADLDLAPYPRIDPHFPAEPVRSQPEEEGPCT